MDQQLPTTADFLNQIKARYGLKTWYQVADKMGVPRTDVSRWKRGRGGLGEENCALVAELLDLPPGYVLAAIYSHRQNKGNVPALWHAIAEVCLRAAGKAADKMSTAAGVLVIVTAGLVAALTPNDSKAFEAMPVLNAITDGHQSERDPLYIMRTLARNAWCWAARAARRWISGVRFGALEPAPLLGV